MSLGTGASIDLTSAALPLDDAMVVAAWCSRYGVTIDQLTLATTLVGLMPAALHFYLTSHGRPTKVVTDEMRASRVPIRPRDRRRKPVVAPIPAGTVDVTSTDVETLRHEHSKMALNVRIAADALHEHPCPANIHAYDEAQERLDATAAKLDIAENAAISHRSAASASR